MPVETGFVGTADDSARITGVLSRLERERRTGVLRIGDDGAFLIEQGAVAFAESRHAPALGGGLGPELSVLLGVFDAAYFLLGSEADPEFSEGPVRPPDPSCRLATATLVHEHARRRALLDSAWPSADVDRAPVVPVRRVHRQRVILTGLQMEILLNADGRRTPVELARDLGRTGFACLLAVRGLAAASLVRTITEPDGRTALNGGPAPDGGPVPHELATVSLARTREPDGGPAPRGAEIPRDWAPPDLDVLERLRAALEEFA